MWKQLLVNIAWKLVSAVIDEIEDELIKKDTNDMKKVEEDE